MGVEGTLVISESSGRSTVYREKWVEADKWEPWVKKGYIKAIEEEQEEEEPVDTGVVLNVEPSPLPPSYDIPIVLDKPIHHPHLENFFEAIRGNAKLNCPAEIGYETAVAVLKVNEAVEAERKLQFGADEFAV